MRMRAIDTMANEKGTLSGRAQRSGMHGVIDLGSSFGRELQRANQTGVVFCSEDAAIDGLRPLRLFDGTNIMLGTRSCSAHRRAQNADYRQAAYCD
jgi:hypothetical protein